MAKSRKPKKTPVSIKAVKAWAMTSPRGTLWPPAVTDKHDLSQWFREQYDESRVVRVSIVPRPSTKRRAR